MQRFVLLFLLAISIIFLFCFIAILKPVIAAYLLVLASHEEKLTSHPLKHALEDDADALFFQRVPVVHTVQKETTTKRRSLDTFFCFVRCPVKA